MISGDTILRHLVGLNNVIKESNWKSQPSVRDTHFLASVNEICEQHRLFWGNRFTNRPLIKSFLNTQLFICKVLGHSWGWDRVSGRSTPPGHRAGNAFRKLLARKATTPPPPPRGGPSSSPSEFRSSTGQRKKGGVNINSIRINNPSRRPSR